MIIMMMTRRGKNYKGSKMKDADKQNRKKRRQTDKTRSRRDRQHRVLEVSGNMLFSRHKQPVIGKDFYLYHC